MISVQSLYKENFYSSSVTYEFPEDERAVESFFKDNKLLPHFTKERMNYTVQSLAGKSQDILSIMGVLERAVQLKGEGQVPLSTDQLALLKNNARETLDSINKKSTSVLGVAGMGSGEKISISILELPITRR